MIKNKSPDHLLAWKTARIKLPNYCKHWSA